ncbi:Two component system, signal transduction histidine kinase [Acididesulfobacillus acetoxydans]|uniref:histidine kinase n=1 Tax=Acididesulfobacillus acetoxydans TaxID=1561005 RepID=A0A8S0WVD4_9FIRM|nr:ATP-binding protein [Acididesulfobacillus acetoxydans]CAA7599511.1 Two component system, signal transduction histidine kinase [Acididesulfobacillus acetoxydans]CEJ08680.1 Signal transduction histidine kinase [Acididesulfobacillus acetoxydans]
MTLRRKFLFALVGLVIFLSLIFGGISLWSMQSLLGHAVQYIGQSYSQQWERLLTYYYEQEGSWNGVQSYVSRIIADPHQDWLMGKDNEHLLLFDARRKVVVSFRPQDVGRSVYQLAPPLSRRIPFQWHPIQVQGKTVGYYWFDQGLIDRDAFVAKRIAASVFRAMLVGLVVTTLAALGLGVFITRRLTGPLRRLTEAVKQVGQGDLNSRLEVQGRDDIALLTGAFNGMTARLARNEEVRRNMVADIAHELRTPLAVILGKLESIQEGVLPSTPEVLLPIQDETLRLIRLVQDLQQLTLAEAGKLPLNRREVDLKVLLERILERFAIEFQERKITAGIEGWAPALTADPDRLTQVFVNLVGNALLHTPAGGAIYLCLSTVSAPVGEEKRNYGGEHRDALNASPEQERRQSAAHKGVPARTSERETQAPGVREWAKVEVVDTGEGIPPEELDHIFDRFYRVDKARERETGRTGLGLAIAWEFVQAHGGMIRVASRVNEGTTFAVWLPAGGVSPSSERAAGRRPGGGLTRQQ